MNETLLEHRREIETAQLAALNRLLAEIYGKNRFYTAKLDEAGITGSVTSLEEFTRKMPFTLKQELVDDQDQSPPYGTVHTYPIDQYIRYHQTSGTTSRSLKWLDTKESWAWCVNNWRQVFEAGGVAKGDRIFFAFSFGPFLGFWTAFSAAQEIGCLCIPGGGMSSAARLKAIHENQANVLCCTPTYALRLAEAAQENGFDLSQTSIKKIIVGGEPGGNIPTTRKTIEESWNGARLFDHHGMTEVGPVSFESLENPGHLHIIESSYLVEILNPETGEPVDEGGSGELVLTTLGREAAPLLRYRTGDLVKPSWKGRDAYGRDEIVMLGGILGRIDDMVVVRGVNIFPSAVEEVIRKFDDVQEYRVLISEENALTEISLEIEPKTGCPDPKSLTQSIKTAMRDAFHLRVPVDIVAPDTLPRFEMKAKRWIRK